MIIKTKEKAKALSLRKQGKSYSQILLHVSVAKSTLAIWFREAGIGQSQSQRITKNRIAAQKRGAQKRKTQRILRTEEIFQKAVADVGSLSARELWLIGTVLYWAEGTKQKEWNVSQSLQFTNSDPEMVRFYIV